MTCQVFNLGGSWAIACDRRRPSHCSVPGCNRNTVVLCDFAVTRKGRAGTCDAKLCETHAKHVATDRDFCPAHAKATP